MYEPLRSAPKRQITLLFTFSGKSIVTGSADGSLRVWSPKTGECVATFQGHPFHEEGLTSVHVSADSALAISGSTDKTARLVHLQNGKVRGERDLLFPPVSALEESVNAMRKCQVCPGSPRFFAWGNCIPNLGKATRIFRLPRTRNSFASSFTSKPARSKAGAASQSVIWSLLPHRIVSQRANRRPFTDGLAPDGLQTTDHERFFGVSFVQLFCVPRLLSYTDCQWKRRPYSMCNDSFRNERHFGDTKEHAPLGVRTQSAAL